MKHLAGQGDDSRTDPCVALLNIVSLDTQGLFRLITAALDDVKASSMNDYLLQERLLHWQTLINKIVIELTLKISSIEGLVNNYFQGTPTPAQVQDILVKLHHRTDKLVKKTKKCHMSLRADVAILDSKRQIAEAESVSRLTEFGFIFIPLSFAASALSMQINELENRIPLSTFVIVCVVLAAIAYSTRLLVRNSFVKSIRRTSFRKGSSVRRHFAWKRETRAYLRVMASDVALASYSAIHPRHRSHVAHLRRAVGSILDPEPLGYQLQDRTHATHRSAQPCSRRGIFDFFLRRGG